MNKSELTDAVIAKRAKDFDKYGLSKAVVDRIVNDVFSTMTETLLQGEEVRIDKFGVFTVEHRKERPGRNVITGEPLTIKARSVVKFAMASNLKKGVADVKA